MPTDTFYWVGSTAANINSLRWDVAGNWMVIKRPVYSLGQTLASWQRATRSPLGLDVVRISPNWGKRDSSYPGTTRTLSPLIFGGVCASGNFWAWTGSTTGTNVFDKHAAISSLAIHPEYPFSQIGGRLNKSLLNEWMGWAKTYGGISSWGTSFDTVGNTADGEPTALYQAVLDGVTVSISIPTVFQGNDYINVMGSVYDSSKSGMNVYIRGVSSGISAGGMKGWTGYYDGSQNTYTLMSYQIPQVGSYGRGTIFNVPDFGMGTNYKNGNAIISGLWSEVQISQGGRSGGNLTFLGVTANRIRLAPDTSIIALTPNDSSAGQPNPYWWVSNVVKNGATGSKASLDSIYFDPTSTCLTFTLGDLKNGTLDTVGELIVQGDMRSNHGFKPFIQLYGGLTGGSAGAINTLGNLVLNPSISLPTYVSVGYPSSEANTTGSSITLLDNLYVLSGNGKEPELGINGNFTCYNAYLEGGRVYLHPSIDNDNNVNLLNITMTGDSTLDLSSAPNHKGIATTIDFESPNCKLIPNKNLKVTTTTQVVVIRGREGLEEEAL